MKQFVTHVDPSIADNIARISPSQFQWFGFEPAECPVLEIFLETTSHFVCVKSSDTVNSTNMLVFSQGLAESLELREDDEVLAKRHHAPQQAAMVFVTPATIDDYEVIETNQRRVENVFLSQTRVAYLRMQVRINLFHNLSVNLIVQNIKGSNNDSDRCYLLLDGTELAIETKVRQTEEKKRFPVSATLANIAFSHPVCVSHVLQQCFQSLRGKAGPYTCVSAEVAANHDWSNGDTLGVVSLHQLATLSFESLSKESPNPLHMPNGIENSPTVIRSCTNSTVVILQDDSCCSVDGCPIRSLWSSTWVFNFLFSPGELLYFFPVKDESVPQGSVGMGELWRRLRDDHSPPSIEKHAQKPSCDLLDVDQLLSTWTKRCLFPGNHLIVGERGTGKTAYLRYLHMCLPSVFLDGRKFASARPNERITRLKAAFMACALIQSVLLIDNIDAIFESKDQNQQNADPDVDPNIVNVASMLRILLDLQRNGRQFYVIASRRPSSGTFPTVLERSFANAFPRRLHLKDLHSENAVQLFAESFPGFDAISREVRTSLRSYFANFTPKDVLSFAASIMHATQVFGKSIEDALSATRSTFQPIAQGNVKTLLIDASHSVEPQNRLDDSVAGMRAIKKKLRDVIYLPTQSPEKFASLPLKLSRGVLLYGPSGCGKTFLLKEYVRTHGLRCITVNGPEILQKYVGSSEAKVRNIFEQAQHIAPAVIFIDEIDACVPQRGNDHTGITDRVVNQFLCELDGVESRSAVYVVGATSRPEVIDKALLRPGRLDTMLHCSLPSADERSTTLQLFAESPRHRLEPSPDYQELAQRMDGWSFADIHSAFERSLDESLSDLIDASCLLTTSADKPEALEVELVAKGGLSNEEANKLLSAYTEKFAKRLTTANIAGKPSLESPVVPLECFERMVQSMRPSVSPVDVRRIEAFGARDGKSVAMKQRMAMV